MHRPEYEETKIGISITTVVAIALASAFMLEVFGYIYMAVTDTPIPERFDTLSATTLAGLLGLLAKPPRIKKV